MLRARLFDVDVPAWLVTTHLYSPTLSTSKLFINKVSSNRWTLAWCPASKNSPWNIIILISFYPWNLPSLTFLVHWTVWCPGLASIEHLRETSSAGVITRESLFLPSLDNTTSGLSENKTLYYLFKNKFYQEMCPTSTHLLSHFVKKINFYISHLLSSVLSQYIVCSLCYRGSKLNLTWNNNWNSWAAAPLSRHVSG